MIKKHVKMKVVSEEQYLKLQDLLFDNGIYWGSDGFHREKSDYCGAKHIFVYARGFTQDTFSDSTTWFNNHHNTFIETSDYIKRRGLKHPFLLKRKGI